jgi:predicted O-linked N-acetylglucosamine transferase (SPINDLY family)
VKGADQAAELSPADKAAAALQSGDLARAAMLAARETQRRPANAFAWEVLSLATYRRGSMEAAVAAAAQAAALSPDVPGRHANLGVILRAAGQPQAAEQAYRAAIGIDPDFAAAHQNLGNLLMDRDRLVEAESSLNEALRLAPTVFEARRSLGLVFQRTGRLPEAVEALQAVVAAAPNHVQALNDLGACLMALDQVEAAMAALDQALRVQPDFGPAHGNLGALHLRGGRLFAAREATERAMSPDPTEARWISNLAVISKDMGEFDAAENLFRRALAIRPDYANGHANLLFCLNYHPDKSAEEIFKEYRRWDERHALGKPAAVEAFANDPSPDRRLRLGLVSPDFREHSARHYLEPILAGLDRQAFEVFCYAELARPDAVTERFQAMADHWRPTAGLSDEAMAARIVEDGIDILLDLGGHTASSRLGVFARKCAPVQVAHFLGHGYTSGLSAIDAFIADDQLAPAGSDHLFSERQVVRLPRIPLAYAPPEGMPEPSAAPVLTKGHITFGYFGRPERINARVVDAWARIMREVPTSRLMLNAKAFGEPRFKALFETRFAEQGIPTERLDLVYTSPQPRTWDAYGQVDIALDPFPHNAGATTIEALWLGIPVLSIKDRPSVGRFGASILSALGLTEWIAEDVDGYVAKAVAAAHDIDALAVLRNSLRECFLASPLADAQGLGRALGSALRGLWGEWCGQGGQTAASVRASTEAPDLAEAARLAQRSDDLRLQGRLPEAEAAAREALRLDPTQAAAANHLGNALVALGRVLEADEAYGLALDLRADYAEVHNNRALSRMKRGQLCDAETDLRRAMALRPDLPEIGFNLASAIQDQGRLEEALAVYRAAVDACPHQSTGHGALLFCLSYQPNLSGEAVFAEFQRWDARHARPHTPENPTFDNDPSSERRLRIAYVSPDFGLRSARHFIEPMLAGHNRAEVEVFCYAETPNPDAATARFQSLADHWRSTVGLSDQAMADMIRADRIDVLVDLGGHTARNRLLALARKPAPVQIAHFLGHGYTSGMAAMDVFLADEALAPAGSEALFAESVKRLDRIPIAYQPPEGLPEVAPLPALANGFVTFGHFGRTVRINDEVVAAWARILLSVPGSRLVLNHSAYSDPGVKARYEALFAAQGVEAERLSLVFTTPQPLTWDAYGTVDIALDPFPHNAGTTTIEAMWLGAPVVTLAGRPSVGRFGVSILTAAGLTDWIAETVDDYVTLAVRMASDLPALARLRAELRVRMEASPLGDGEVLAQALEAAYRGLWREWCAASGPSMEALIASAAGAYQRGDLNAAAADFRKAAELGDDAASWSNLGACLRSLGRPDEAEAALREAIRCDPALANAHANLGNVLTALGRLDEAQAAYLRGIDLQPDAVETWRSLALCRNAAEDGAGALAAARQAVALAPHHAAANETLASLMRKAGEPVGSLRHYQRAIAGAPGDARILSNAAVAMQDLGQFAGSESLLRQALDERPDYASGHANLLFCLNYHPDKSAEEIFEEYRRWDERHALGKPAAVEAFANHPSPDRRLRLGLVSPDFREHSARHYLEPILAGLDRQAFEVFCYAELARPDAVTERFQAMADHWRPTAGLSDEAMAARIVEDRIDILLDLGGHTASSRLGVFARKCAPVQVAHFLGHGYTSGLSAIDAFIADAELAPEGSDHLFSERQVVRLPRIPLAYAPPEGMPEPSPAPVLTKGHITFGYFGRPERINARVVEAWARILREVPTSRLMLNAKAFGEPQFKALFETRFAEQGIPAERLDLVHTSPQPRTWDAYGQVDIALDPFPHNAGATTIEALWLGVPVLSIKDRPSVGRFGASILTALSLADWIAEDVDGYVAKAVAAAGDVEALAVLRNGLRERFIASPLADAQGLGRALGSALRGLWSEWCAMAPDQANARAPILAEPEPAVERQVPAPIDEPNPDADVWVREAATAFATGNLQGAIDLATRALSLAPDHAEAHHVRGAAAFRSGDIGQAAADIGRCVALSPNRAEPRWNLTAVLRARGDLVSAEAQGRAAAALAPHAPEAWNNLGAVFQDMARAGEAEACFRKSIELRPDNPNAWTNLAWAKSVLGRGAEAEEAARRALALNPNDANSYNNLGSALMLQDRLDEAADAFRVAVAKRPDFVMAHSNLLFCLNYSPDRSAEAIFAEYRLWDSAHARPLAPAKAVFDLDRDPDRRLRVGYVSPDFRHHAVSFFVEPWLAAHDRSKVEVVCYSDVRNPDAVTDRFKALAGRWRHTVGLSDDQMAAMIREDRIDVLVDLAGHTSGNRLTVFARRAAPVQVAHMVGAGCSTGMAEMDAFLTDADLAPPGSEVLFSEALVRLPRVPLVYAPPAGMPEVSASPAARNGYVTFGCFSRTARINAAVLDAWAAILAATPGARLMLNSKPFQEEAGRAAFTAKFAERGVSAHRLDLVYTSPQPNTWAAYGEIDIALDPFPHNAGTTTIEALWLGVPVVSLAARPPVGRFGKSLLGAVGLSDWAVDDVAAYVAKAVSAAADPAALAELRAGLRARFEASPLRDARGLAAATEDAYRALWRDWLARTDESETEAAA